MSDFNVRFTVSLVFFGSSLFLHLLIFYRYAMTVWYFDAEERAEAKKKFRNLTRKTESALTED